MNDVFSDLLDVCIVVYLDDILIYSDDITQHQSHVKEVLKQLRKVGLYAKAEKYEFHSDSDAQLVVETDASDYALAAILSIMTKDNEIHPVVFHSRTFSAPELNYDIHDKELLVIFKAFKIWRHYLEGSASPIDVVTDHKNLEYFSTTKILTRRQARWLEYLSQFNLVIRFCPGRTH